MARCISLSSVVSGVGSDVGCAVGCSVGSAAGSAVVFTICAQEQKEKSITKISKKAIAFFIDEPPKFAKLLYYSYCKKDRAGNDPVYNKGKSGGHNHGWLELFFQ
jgi:hypothetical protein